MFGLFKKPDPFKTINQSRETLSILSQGDKIKSAKNIVIISKMLSDECQTLEEAISMSITNKTIVIREYKLKNHRHPAYMQMEIILEILINCSGHSVAEQHAVDTLKEILQPLTSEEKLDIQKNLRKFVTIELL